MKIELTKIPEDIIKAVTPENWEELFDEQMIFEKQYVYDVETMKEFIKALLDKKVN